jgi:hypothetical protein
MVDCIEYARLSPRDRQVSFGQGIVAMTTARVLLKLTSLERGREDYSSTRCPACDDGLVFHQPDPRLPYRMLASCGNCSGWFLLDLKTALIIQLPWGEIFYSAMVDV